MVTQVAPITFQYSHTIGRQEVRSGNGFFMPVAITRDPQNRLYVLSRGSETPAFFPCKRVTVFTADEEFIEGLRPEDSAGRGRPRHLSQRQFHVAHLRRPGQRW